MRNMRVYRSLQAKIGEIDISKIKLDENSKDDIQRALRGIQTLYNNKEAMEQVCAVNKKVKVHHHRHGKVHHYIS